MQNSWNLILDHNILLLQFVGGCNETSKLDLKLKTLPKTSILTKLSTTANSYILLRQHSFSSSSHSLFFTQLNHLPPLNQATSAAIVDIHDNNHKKLWPYTPAGDIVRHPFQHPQNIKLY